MVSISSVFSLTSEDALSVVRRFHFLPPGFPNKQHLFTSSEAAEKKQHTTTTNDNNQNIAKVSLVVSQDT